MILVTGANGVVGQPLLAHLSSHEIEHLSVTRQTFIDQEVVDQVSWDLSGEPTEAVRQQLSDCEHLIHCAPIWLLPPQLNLLVLAGIKRMIIFSSTSVISKLKSEDQSEQGLVKLLIDAEENISEHCKANNIQFTILRPSMIYGYGQDENVSHIARFIHKRGFMLLMGQANGKRQPVHADDLVGAAMAVLTSDAAINTSYNLAGGEVLTYRVMVERIFIGLNRPRRIFTLPLWAFRIGLTLAAKLTKFNYTPEMANRMNQDLVYSSDAAKEDFGYQPQAFLCNPERDLP